MEVSHTIEIFLRSHMAESGPPLGTVLGNIGVNAIKFCKEFNDFTLELPSYFFLKVKILVFIDKNYSFSIFLPSLGFFLSILKFERVVVKYGRNFTENCISTKSVVQLAKLKFPYLNLKISVPIICGTVRSANLIIV